MSHSSLSLSLFALAMFVAFLLALLTAVGAGVLVRLDGATVPATLLRAGVAFGGSLTLLTAILGIGISALT